MRWEERRIDAGHPICATTEPRAPTGARSSLRSSTRRSAISFAHTWQPIFLSKGSSALGSISSGVATVTLDQSDVRP